MRSSILNDSESFSEFQVEKMKCDKKLIWLLGALIFTVVIILVISFQVICVFYQIKNFVQIIDVVSSNNDVENGPNLAGICQLEETRESSIIQ